jgi:DNA repair protein RadC
MTSLTFQTYRLQLVRERPEEFETDPILDSPEVVSRQLSPLFEGLDREHFVVLALDARNRPIGCNTVSVGSLSASIVHPREIFKFAILANASSIILAHNHPSGDLSPSRDDIELTKRIVEAGTLMGIDVLDHLIVGGGEFLSMKEKGLM